jgi:hypothetical protein
LIYIEAAHDSGMVLGTTINDEVILETLVPNKPEQLWEQGDPDTDGYFNLINSNTRGLMTAVSSSALDVRGKGRFSLFNLFIDMRSTVSFSISRVFST